MPADLGGENRLRQVYDVLDGIDSPRFFIGISAHGLPAAPLKTKALRRKLQQWLTDLNYEEMMAVCGKEKTQRTELHHSEAGVRLVFTAIPKRKPGVGARAIGMQLGEARWIGVADAIKRRLLNKVGKYGQLEAPLVVAVNAHALAVDRDDVIDALFGHFAVVVHRDTGRTQETRTPDGFWWGPKGEQNTRIVGVIWIAGMNAWNIADKVLEFVPNPWAAKSLPEVSLPLRRLKWEGNGFVVEEGCSIGEALALPRGWPEALE